MRAHSRRGAAMITVLILMGLLAVIVAGLMTYVYQQRLRTIAAARSLKRESCAENGMQYARAFFAANFANWNSYLSNPTNYNSQAPAGVDGGVYEVTTGIPGSLLYDLDGDGLSDVYIFIRDNPDELKPAIPNPAQDNDQNVFIGAVCISSTMSPRRPDGKVSPNLLKVEGLLSYNLPNNGYSSQAGGGTSGVGNLNN